jgi:hypothetical protein
VVITSKYSRKVIFYFKNDKNCKYLLYSNYPLNITNTYYWNLAKGVEDGGLSWLRKSCQRMKEQAQKENRNFEDIVAEKYGVSIYVLRIYILLS